ncbi:MAG: DUF2279 domain-containing protein [Cytophagales bacterium]
MKRPLLFIIAFGLLLRGHAQDSTEFNSRKFNTYLIGTAAVYTGTLIGLQALWYSDSEQRSFHFFNDNGQWKQVDKIGHAYSSYQLGRISYDLLKNAGVPRKKAIFWGGLTGFLMLTPIEILDGFAEDYGASYGDLIANATGSGILMTQLYFWDEIRIKPKFSFHRTSYSKDNPQLLGSNFYEEIFKDYNGQSYWLSVDINAFIKSENKFVKWVNIALGYGAEDMLLARDGPNRILGYHPYRQFYFGLDPDLSHLKGQNKWLNTVIYILDGIKLPGPTLVFQRDKVLFRPLYF